jgi:surface protein
MSTVTTISFSVNQATNSYNLYRAFKFGDFIGYREQSDSTTIYVKATSNSALTDGKIHVKNGAGMFSFCSALTTLDLSLFDTSKTKDMGNMFSNCTALTTLNLSAFDTSNVKTMSGMFGSDKALTTLDVSNFDTSKVQNMIVMFSNCSSLTSLDLSSFDMSNVTNYSRMFENAGITTLKCPKINPHNDIPLPRTLYSQDGTAYTNLPVTTGTSIELRASWT